MPTKIAVFPGDGAAATAVDATVTVLNRLRNDSEGNPELSIEVHRPEEDKDVLDSGDIPDRYRTACATADTILFGACDTRHAPLLWYLRYEYGGGMVANVRPIEYFEGVHSPLNDPSGVDMVLVRENLEGLYYRAEGDLEDLAEALPRTGGAGDRKLSDLGEGVYALRVASEQHTQNFAELACQLVDDYFKQPPVTVTAASKSNVLPETAGLFDDCVQSAVENQAEFSFEQLHADDVAQRLVTAPEQFDVIVTPNYAGDILSDGAAGTVGGLGVAPSGCFGTDRTAYFEPVHGAAPDIDGSEIINPTATMLSAVMMLEHEGHRSAARRLRTAIESVYASGSPLTPDQGGSADTAEFTNAVVEYL